MANAGMASPTDHYTIHDEEEHSRGLTKADTYGKKRTHESHPLQGLPFDVLCDKVLLLLPFPKICQLRCVCKAWKAMLSSSNFLYQIQQQSCDDSWLVMKTKSKSTKSIMRGKELVAYIPSLGRWFPFPGYFSPGNMALRRCGYKASFMASAGGLICFVAREVQQPSSHSLLWKGVLDGVKCTLRVFNPMTGSMKTLPSLPSSPLVSSMYLSMLYDQRSNSYKVVVNCSKYGYYRFFLEVYDSETGAWRQVCREISAHSDIQDADLFTFHASEKYGQEPSWKLEGYHLESNTWSSINVPFSGKVTGEELVYKFKGRILLVQKFSPPRGSLHIKGFTIWELKHINNNTNNRSTLTWENVAATPPEVLQSEYPRNATFISNGKLICMTSRDFLEPPLVYDLVLNSWYVLPSYNHGAVLRGLFSFTPSSTTPF